MLKSKIQKGSSKSILSSQYFLYFGVMGIILPYFNLYCFHIGFNGYQIGVLSALRTGAITVFPLLWGILADRSKTRRSIYILCSFMSAAIWVFFLYTTDYMLMVIITIFHGIFHSPIISFLEAFTMDLLGKEKKAYGRVRVWGTISFVLVATCVGLLVDFYPLKIILALVLAGSILQAIISIRIPDVVPVIKDSYATGTKVFLKMPTVVFLSCAFLMLVSHGAYYGFFSIHLESLGYGNKFIGAAWALASVSEILVMVKSKSIFKRFSLENVLVFSFATASIRWFALSFVNSPFAIILSQTLHAITYGTFHMASIIYIDQHVPDEAKTFGQAVNNAVTYGLGMMVGFFISGYLFENFGSSVLFVSSALIAGLGGGLMWSFKKLQKSADYH
jgi:PPP family 3-phenylpropionic acid transporter